ncbi:MAG: isoprenoid biosynthesis glyoxalase ElbB [Planctomycetes bacterium]|nr:isoprenoid biosynthesis glyoxalase ElbB [Planctomycetota bacterium]
MSKKIGVILSGCGYLDGAEISESVLALLHLDRAGCQVVCMAPRQPQMHVVDHVRGAPVEGETRDVFAEAARIARGKVRDIAEVRPDELDGLVMPGGYGAAKNLSSFAVAGADGEVHPDVQRLLRAMHEQRKPIGVICIAPAVCALAFRGTDVQPTLTIGQDPGTAKAVEATGAHHENAPVTGICVDETNRIVSTPAYMYDARVADVSTGIEKLVKAVVSMA